MRAVLEEFQPGRRIFLPGATGESLALAAALRADPERMRGVTVVNCALPGMNETDYASLHPDGRMILFLPGPVFRDSLTAKRAEALPLSYSKIAAYLTSGPGFDVAIAQVSAPDAANRASFGIAADFAPLAWRNARRRVAIVNPDMPAMPRGPRLDLAQADVVVTQAAPLIYAPAFRPHAQLDAIAANVAALVPDGAAIQLGIGGAPAAVWRQLDRHRHLSITSGMVAEDAALLHEAGALRPGGHRAGVAYGSAEFYRYLANSDLVEFATTLETHGAPELASIQKFTAINAAIEVDLFGQVNAEWRGGQLISGIGGAPDFCRAAAASPGGRAIIALPAAAKAGAGTTSRIVPRLMAPAVSLSRGDIDTVVTEFGVAELKTRGLDARADALIGVAAPEHRTALDAAWCELRRTF
jgi:acyl-CoA hydrolase